MDRNVARYRLIPSARAAAMVLPAGADDHVYDFDRYMTCRDDGGAREAYLTGPAEARSPPVAEAGR